MTREFWRYIITGVIILVVLGFMVSPMKEQLQYNKSNMYCEVSYCSKITLDEFENCIDLGIESSGFLSSNHYYLCDGNKITSMCLEYSMKEYEGEYILGLAGRGSCKQKEGGGE